MSTTPKCQGCPRHCEFNAKPIKIHKQLFYIPTINGTPTEQHFPFKTQAFFCTVESCIVHAEKISKTCTRYNHTR